MDLINSHAVLEDFKLQMCAAGDRWWLFTFLIKVSNAFNYHRKVPAGGFSRK